MTTTHLLTQKELAGRWGVCLRSVQRRVREFAIKPVDFTGNMPVFALADVVKLEQQRLAERSARLGFTPPAACQKVISVKEAKRLAKRKGGRK